MNKERSIREIEQSLISVGINPKKCVIAKDDYNTRYGKELANNAEELKGFKKYAIKEYNETGNLGVLLENLKIIAIAKGIRQVAQKSDMKRQNMYKFLSKESNPTYAYLTKVAGNLGLEFKLAMAK
jgi:probable addiction module antidote protein